MIGDPILDSTMPRRAKQGPEGDCARLGDPHKHNEQGERGAKKPRTVLGARLAPPSKLAHRATTEHKQRPTTMALKCWSTFETILTTFETILTMILRKIEDRVERSQSNTLAQDIPYLRRNSLKTNLSRRKGSMQVQSAVLGAEGSMLLQTSCRCWSIV